MREPVAHDIVLAPEDEPLVLAGPPRELAGRVELHNRGAVNVVLRDAGLRDPSGVLNIRQLRHVMPPLVLRPNQGRIVRLKVAVNPTTPPGEYRAELDLGGRSRHAVLHVSEVFALTVQPRSVVVLNRPGHAQLKRVIVTNDGNVAFAIGDVGPIDLKDDMVLDRAVRVAIEPLTDRANLDIEEIVLAVLRVAREDAYRPGSLLVHTLGGKVDVPPGETVAIDLEITLREALPHNSRYRGRAALLTEDLEIVVVSSSGPVEGEPQTTSAPRAARPVGRAATGSRKSTKRQGGGS